jgi:hypothetical protein
VTSTSGTKIEHWDFKISAQRTEHKSNQNRLKDHLRHSNKGAELPTCVIGEYTGSPVSNIFRSAEGKSAPSLSFSSPDFVFANNMVG